MVLIPLSASSLQCTGAYANACLLQQLQLWTPIRCFTYPPCYYGADASLSYTPRLIFFLWLRFMVQETGSACIRGITGSPQILNHPPFKNRYLPKPIFTCSYWTQHAVYSADCVQMPSHSRNSHWHPMHQLTETERLINASHTLMAIVYNLVIIMNFYRCPFTRRLTYPYKPVLESVSTRLVGKMYLFVILHQWNQLTLMSYDSIMRIFDTLSNLNAIFNNFDVIKQLITHRCVLW